MVHRAKVRDFKNESKTGLADGLHITTLSYIASGTCGDNLTWTLSDDYVLTISGTGAMTYYSSNSSIPWYSYQTNITNVVIESGTTSIGSYAFSGCTSLSSISIPSSVTSIGSSAFSGCKKISSLNIGSVESWCKIPFGTSTRTDNSHTYIILNNGINPLSCTTSPVTLYINGEEANDIIIPNTVTTIHNDLFRRCQNITSVVIPSSVTSIGFSAFYGCTSLSSISIPEGVTTIGDEAFSGCTSLSCITIPEGVTLIGYDVFSGCTSLSSITIPSSVTSIGQNAFSGCTSLSSITIPSSVTSIGQNAFSGCTSLSSISIPSSVTSIGSFAFYGCTSLSSISIPSSVTSIGSFAFYGCTSLSSITIPDGVTSVGTHAFCGCKSLSDISIPEGVTSIGNYAFSGCSSLSCITIPSSVTSIGDCAFSYCSRLNSISCLSTDVPSIASTYAFNQVPSTCKVYVPMSAYTDYTSDDVWNTLNIIGVENGDVNLSQSVNITDAVEVVNNVLGNPSERFAKEWSDVNGDNQYTIADASAVINVILGEEIGTAEAKSRANNTTPDELTLKRTDANRLTMCLDNKVGYNAFQFDVVLPEGMTIENVLLNQNRCADYSVMFRETSVGHYTVAAFNFDNSAFATGSGSLLNIITSGNGNDDEITISNIHFATTKATDVQFGDLTVTEATDIIDINTANGTNSNSTIYDLTGRKLQNAKSGVNIINGKKVIIK